MREREYVGSAPVAASGDGERSHYDCESDNERGIDRRGDRVVHVEALGP